MNQDSSNPPSDFEAKSFQTDVGIRAEVTRESNTGETAAHAAGLIRQAGREIKATLAADKQLEYVGSACVHIFQSEILGQIFYATQTPLGGSNQLVTDKALTQLIRDCKAYYGMKPGRLRSGF